MRVTYTSEYARFRQRVLADDRTRGTGGAALLLAMESVVLSLEHEPQHDSPTLAHVRQANRHRLWRVSHPFRAEVALRIVVWFHEPTSAVLVLLGHDKAEAGNAWYGYAAAQGQSIVDQYLRQRAGSPP